MYTIPLSHQGYVLVPDDATEEEIRAEIEDDLPKYIQVRMYEGVGEEAEYEEVS